jgi:hypothetical protein
MSHVIAIGTLTATAGILTAAFPPAGVALDSLCLGQDWWQEINAEQCMIRLVTHLFFWTLLIFLVESTILNFLRIWQ